MKKMWLVFLFAFFLSLPVLADDATPDADDASKKFTPIEISLAKSLQLFGPEYSVRGARFNLFYYGDNVSVTGLDLGLFNSTESMTGFQLGSVNSAGELNGVQVGGFNVIAANGKGFQLGIVNIGMDFFGSAGASQIGLVNMTGELEGFQIGFYNTSTKLKGFQAGIFNEAEQLSGLQLGFLNVEGNEEKKYLPLVRYHISF